MIDMLPPADLVRLVKDKPSLRGMVLGNLAELLFERHVPARYSGIMAADIVGHDDHDRSLNKSDRTITRAGRRYTVQVKSIQTGTITRERATGRLVAKVQNDGSDSRTVKFPDGSELVTVCYLRGEYDILAVPLFPFTGDDSFAYKRNADCNPSSGRSYTDVQKANLLATCERISWPLTDHWETDLMRLLTPDAGSPVSRLEVIHQPGGEVRVGKARAIVLPDED